MKILCTYANAYGGGTESVLLNGLPFLNSIPGVRVTFADLYSRPSVSRKFEEMGVATWPNGGKTRASILSFRSGLRRKLDIAVAIPTHLRIALQLRPAVCESDVLYVHGYKDLVLCLAARLVTMRRSPPVVLHCHGLDERFVPPVLSTLANRCARVIAISEDVRNRLVAIGVKPSIIRTIYDAVDHRRLEKATLCPPSRPLPPTSGRRVILVCPAAIRSLKGIHLASEALRHLPPDVDLWVTGDQSDPAALDYLNCLVSQAARDGVKERVYFIGLRDDLPTVMSLAYLICVPSLWREGFCLVAAEAMALGRPVVASSRGALPEVVGESGLIFDPDQPGDLARQLSALIADPTLAASLGASGRRSVVQRFTYDRWAREVITELRAAVAANTYLKPLVSTDTMHPIERPVDPERSSSRGS